MAEGPAVVFTRAEVERIGQWSASGHGDDVTRSIRAKVARARASDRRFSEPMAPLPAAEVREAARVLGMTP
jgi:hypothetical protein